MQYMLLIYSGEESGQLSPEELQAGMSAHRELMDETAKKGILLGANPLRPSSTATSVRRTPDGQPLITDGPFAETKEQLGGYYLLECKDLDEAIEYAKRIPTRCIRGAIGGVEIRPVLPFAEIQKQLETVFSAQNA